MDVGTASILVSIAGIVLWVLTNWNTARVGKAIKSDIDAKRAETQAFVEDALQGLQDGLESKIGAFEARVNAQMPPNVHGELEELKAEFTTAVGKMDEATAKIAAIDAGLGNWTAQMDGKLGQLFGREGASQAALAKMASEAGQDIEGAMQTAMTDQSNPIVRQLYAQLMRPVNDKWAAAHPGEALVIQAGTAWVAQNILPQLAGGGVAGDVTRYGLSKGDKIL